MRNFWVFVSQVLSGLRFRLLLLVVLVCTPLVVLTLHKAWEDRRRQVTNWQQRAQRMMQTATREEIKIIGSTRQLLLAVAESDPVSSGDRRSAKRFFDEIADKYPRYADLGVVATNGEVLASTQSPMGPSGKEEDGFLKKVLDTRNFAWGNSTSMPGGERPFIKFGYPVFNREGQLQAVVFAKLQLDKAGRFGSDSTSQLPRSASWMEVDRAGQVLLNFSPTQSATRQSMLRESLADAVMKEPAGTFEARDQQGHKMLYAFADFPSQLVSSNGVAILGLPQQTLFAGTDRALTRSLASLGLAASLALALGWIGGSLLILRPVKSLVLSSTRLASGDLSARTGLPHGRDELGRLTLSFDLMAQALEQREMERNRASQKLKVLSHRLVEVQETERRSIARELHDEIGQSLTVAEMNLQAALRGPAPDALARRLKDSMAAVCRVLEQVQDLSLSLRPSMLDDLGLEPALRWYAHRQGALTGLRTHFHADALEARLDPLVETECFRVAQEAMTNVVRHSRATTLRVELRRVDNLLQLSVLDDGVGFDVSALRDEALRGASLGLLSMQERAALVGGSLDFITSPGRGTEVRAWFPIKWRALSV